MLPCFAAIAFDYATVRGNTRPVALRVDCGDGVEDGYMVKMRAGFRDHYSGPLNEAVCSLLAQRLGLDVPKPAVIDVGNEFYRCIPDSEPDRKEYTRNSVGPNFGCQNLGADWKTWLPNRRPSPGQRDAAAAIFAFDALVQNSDRGRENPNLLYSGSVLVAYDHENTFGYLRRIPSTGFPWSFETRYMLREHIFFQQLKASQVSFAPFCDALEALSDRDLAEIEECIPVEWHNGDDLPLTIEYIRRVRNRCSEFADSLLDALP